MDGCGIHVVVETPRRRAVISVVIAINPSLGIRSNRATKSARNIVACFPSLGLSFIRLGILFCDSLSVAEPRPRNGGPSRKPDLSDNKMKWFADAIYMELQSRHQTTNKKQTKNKQTTCLISYNLYFNQQKVVSLFKRSCCRRLRKSADGDTKGSVGGSVL